MNKSLKLSRGMTSAGAIQRKQPVAPPVYKPVPVPRVLQRKVATKQQPLACQPKPAPVTPHVHAPQSTTKCLQMKPAIKRQPALSETRNRSVAPPSPPKIARPPIVKPQLLRTPNAVQPKLQPAKQLPAAKPGPPSSSIHRNNSSSVIQRYRYDKEFTSYMEYLTTNENEKSAKILRRLKAAQEAVIYTQNKLVHGPGNVKDAIEESRGRNMSAVRVAREGESGGYVFESDIKRSAIAARRARGGNCDEHGKVAYYRLVHMADSNDYAYLCANGWHVFAILADPPDSQFGRWFSRFGSFDPSTAVVADAWLGPSFAVKFDHWRFKDTAYTIHQSSACFGGARQGDLLKDVRVDDIRNKSERTKKKTAMREKVEATADELYKNPKTTNMYDRWHVLTSEISLRILGMEESKTQVSTPLSSSSSARPSYMGPETQEERNIFGEWNAGRHSTSGESI